MSEPEEQPARTAASDDVRQPHPPTQAGPSPVAAGAPEPTDETDLDIDGRIEPGTGTDALVDSDAGIDVAAGAPDSGPSPAGYDPEATGGDTDAYRPD